MRMLFVLLLICFAGCGKKVDVDTSGRIEIPDMEYIDDLSVFVPGDSEGLDDVQTEALNLANDKISEHLKCDFRGKFFIAEADWGYQVNFTDIEILKDGKWVKDKNGWGEVFFSKNLKLVQMDYGEDLGPDDEAVDEPE